MKRNGFTLMELLSVFVILGILALVTAPIITGVLKDAREDTFEASVKELVNVIKIDYSEHGRMGEKEYIFNGDTLVCSKCNNNEDSSVDYTGELVIAEAATLKVKDGRVNGKITGKEFTANIENNKVTLEENTEN